MIWYLGRRTLGRWRGMGIRRECTGMGTWIRKETTAACDAFFHISRDNCFVQAVPRIVQTFTDEVMISDKWSGWTGSVYGNSLTGMVMVQTILIVRKSKPNELMGK